MGVALPRTEHVVVLTLENRFFAPRPERMLACRDTVSNEACETRVGIARNDRAGDCVPQAVEAVA
jgi:hypothetical protein